jgi:hypothetical protein
MSTNTTSSFALQADYDFLDPFEHSSEEWYGNDFSAEKLIVYTRAFSKIGRGAQVLCAVDKRSVHPCELCGSPITHVQVGNLSFACDVEPRYGESLFLANLLAEHTHSDDSTVGDDEAL